MDIAFIKWSLVTVVIMCHTLEISAEAYIMTFRHDNENGQIFKDIVEGSSVEGLPIGEFFMFMGYTTEDYVFNLKDETSYNHTVYGGPIGKVKKYTAIYQGIPLLDHAITLNTMTTAGEMDVYTGYIAGTIIANLTFDVDQIRNRSDIIDKGREAVHINLDVTIKDDIEPRVEEYIRCIGKIDQDKTKPLKTYKMYKTASEKRPDPVKFERLNGEWRSIEASGSEDISCNAAHVYRVSFSGHGETGEFAKPSVEIAQHDIHEINPIQILNGIREYAIRGKGGNIKIGQHEWGSLNYAGRPLEVTQLDDGTCILRNDHISVDSSLIDDICLPDIPHNSAQVPCESGTSLDDDSEAYGQGNDALAFGSAVYEMLHQWYRDTGLVDSCPMMYICTHMEGGSDTDNAFYDGGTCNVYFGAGDLFYPMASMDIVGHEIGHAYTHHTSDLQYNDCQSGSLNEAYSDMLGETLQAFINNYGNDWMTGFAVLREDLEIPRLGNREALRYYSDPTHDKVSIDCAHDFLPMDPHFGSGVYNKALYLLSNKPNWSLRRAFALFLHANHYYWGSADGYNLAGYKVWFAAYLNTVPGYYFSAEDVEDIRDAFAQVGVTTGCPPGFWVANLALYDYTCYMDMRASCVETVTEALTWDEAQEHCASHDAEVMSMITGSYYDFIKTLNQYYKDNDMAGTPLEFWAGQFGYDSDQDGCILIQRICSFGECVYEINPENCDNAKTFMCQSITCNGN